MYGVVYALLNNHTFHYALVAEWLRRQIQDLLGVTTLVSSILTERNFIAFVAEWLRGQAMGLLGYNTYPREFESRQTQYEHTSIHTCIQIGKFLRQIKCGLNYIKLGFSLFVFFSLFHGIWIFRLICSSSLYYAG